MNGLEELRWTFFLECAELLEALDDGFDRLAETDENAPLDLEEVNAVFRAVHSIKGGAASFALDDLVRFAHDFETVLDAMRSGHLTPDREEWRILRQSGDILAELVAAARDDTAVDIARHAEVRVALAGLIGAKAEPDHDADPEGADAVFQPAPLDLGSETEPVFAPVLLGLDGDLEEAAQDGPGIGEDAGQASDLRHFEVAFAAHPTLFQNGHDPVHLFRELSQMGTLDVAVDSTDLPEMPDAGHCYLRWTLRLSTTCDEEDIREIFEFVEVLADINITRIDVPETKPGLAPVTEPPEEADARPEPESAEIRHPAQPDARPPSTDPKAAASGEQRKAAPPNARKSTVRVDLGLVDDLINIVGELVINQSFLSQSIADAGLSGQPHLTAGLDEFKNLARQIQEGVMAIRAQSVKPLFQRMARIVREASAVADKPVRFETSGEATEVDTTVIERLIDPLTHILRNAVDHGLEDADKRIEAGKPPEGVVRLAADHRSGRVLIEVSDDGSGINRPKVLAIAKERGLLPADATPPDEEIDRLLFQPGFSTADAVTDLSGRGVGMDVVRSAIQKLGGRINIASTPGRGTTISISLPLTLAVLEGMIVKVVGQTMVIPINAVIETLRPSPEEIEPLTEGAEVVRVRDRLVPIVDLGRVFGYTHPRCADRDRVLLLVETEQGRNWALSVDEIRDQRQVVIKSLEENYGRVPGVAAATILGDGRIALIIDPEEAIRSATDSDQIPDVLSRAARQEPEDRHVDA